MCGIAGSFAYRQTEAAVDNAELTKMSQAMRARGPDGHGTWLSQEHRVGFVHRRLAIIDLSDNGKQPMFDRSTGNCIVFNGEIYNFAELRAELERVGHQFQSCSDTEVLLKLYAVYGSEMVHRLRGMYAFAIWDDSKRGIFLARDPFGIKPLYYADDGKCFRFASQVKALIAGGQVSTTPNPAGQVGFYLWGHVPEPYTLYKEIAALPAGNSLWIDVAGRQQQKQFLSVSQLISEASQLGKCATPLSSGEAEEELRAALKESVKRHLVSDVPVGLFLSAGLDSATLAALSVEQQNIVDSVDRLRTITIGFAEYANTSDDEVPLAEVIAQHYGTEHMSRWVNKDQFSERLGHLVRSMDQPSIDGVNSYFVSLAAKEAGVKVAFSGLGGDEIFAGYSSFREIPRMVRLLRPVSRVPGLGHGFRLFATPLLKHFTSPKYAGLLEYGGGYDGAYLLRRGLFMPWELPGVLDGELVKEGWGQLNALTHLQQNVSGIDSSRLRVSALETNCYMRNRLLRDTDWASMAHSVEVRVPLVDIELFRTVSYLVGNGRPLDKMSMAAMPSNPLPDNVLRRKKTGFSIPVQDWLLGAPGSAGTMAGAGLRSWANFLFHNASNI